MTLGYKQHRKEKHEQGSDQEGTGVWFKVPSKYFWPIVIGIFCGYSPAKDVVTGLLPMRGEQKVQQFRDQTTGDNHQLLQNVAIGLNETSNELNNLNFKVVEVEGSVTRIQASLDKIDSRVDSLMLRTVNPVHMSNQ
jgi:hypothetical protein